MIAPRATVLVCPTRAVAWPIACLILLSACSKPAADATSTAGARAPATAATVPADGASAVAAAFYRVHLQARTGGVPDGETLERYRPMLSRRLLDLIAGATRERDAAIAAHPDEKPPFVDGDVFSSLFEGPTGYAIGPRTVLAADRERIEIELTHQEPRTPGITRWSDHALMVREDGQWKLDDIEYGGQWDFASRGRLSDSLRGQD